MVGLQVNLGKQGCGRVATGICVGSNGLGSSCLHLLPSLAQFEMESVIHVSLSLTANVCLETVALWFLPPLAPKV